MCTLRIVKSTARWARFFLVGAILSLATDVLAMEARPPWPARKRRTEAGLLRPGVHELKDPKRWPVEPESPLAPFNAARFQAAFSGLCEGMASAHLLARLADEIRQVADEAKVDPFLLGALVYRESRCVPTLVTPFGKGLMQIQTRMIQANLRGGTLRYQVREGDAWKERTQPIPRGALSRLQNSLINLRLGAATLVMWQDQHPAIDNAFPDSVPHRSAVAHFGWGDVVRGTGGEDRALIARRRLIDRYLDKKTAARKTELGFEVVSPLEGIPRVAPSGPGEDREDGARAHRGLDIDATGGEPIGSIADGVVWFTGFDLPGRVRPQVVPPDELASIKRPELGPGGLFVCIRHVPHIFSCYMHLQSYRVAINDHVKAGQVIANVGHSGIKVSGTHLHLEIHRDGDAIDPAPILGPDFVIPPQETIAHDIAMQSKKHRLVKERRARWKAYVADRKAKTN
jgi:hypothetical protein